MVSHEINEASGFLQIPEAFKLINDLKLDSIFYWTELHICQQDSFVTQEHSFTRIHFESRKDAGR